MIWALRPSDTVVDTAASRCERRWSDLGCEDMKIRFAVSPDPGWLESSELVAFATAIERAGFIYHESIVRKVRFGSASYRIGKDVA